MFRAILLEPNAEIVVRLRECLVAFFEEAGASVVVDPVPDHDTAIVECGEYRCELFVCDVTLNTDEGPIGLNVLDDIKGKHPEIFCIAVTGSDFSYRQSESFRYGFDPVSYTHLTLPTTPYV